MPRADDVGQIIARAGCSKKQQSCCSNYDTHGRHVWQRITGIDKAITSGNIQKSQVDKYASA